MVIPVLSNPFFASVHTAVSGWDWMPAVRDRAAG